MNAEQPAVMPIADSRLRWIVLGAIAAACVAGSIGYARYAAQRAQAGAAAGPQRTLQALATLRELDPKRPHMLFRSTALGDSYGRLSVEYLDRPDGVRQMTGLQCDRLHFEAGRGLCLEARRGAVTVYRAILFDRDLVEQHAWLLTGTPSRARLSPDGKLAATTVFVSGHAYSNTTFSTRTSIVDAGSGRMIVEDLEKLKVLKDGVELRHEDFNVWGVTFARDPNRYYATLATGGKRMLVEGDLAAGTLRLVHDNVECPSLSPDNRRIAFKRRADTEAGRYLWNVVVLDLASGRETLLAAETRSVDDQVEWLGNDEVVYSLPDDVPHASAATNTWALAADGSRPPRLLMPLSYSPAVVE